MHTIYALLKGPGEIFYVGRTTNPMRRLREHQLAHKYNFGSKIILKVLQEVETKEEAMIQERAWIKFYDFFYDLENGTIATPSFAKEADLRLNRYRRTGRIRE